MIRIPSKSKQFIVDNASFSRGNIYSTFNVMFDADIGKVKLNPPITKLYDTTTDASFVQPISMVVAQKNNGGDTDTYIATYKVGTGGYVWSTYEGSLTKLTGTSAPTAIINSDLCLAWTTLHISDNDGLHYVLDDASAGNWTLANAATFKNRKIIIYFQDQDRIYLFDSTSVISATQSLVAANTPTTSGSYTVVAGLSNISCARAASKRIWFASSGANGAPSSKIYEWDGVQTNPLNIFTIDTSTIQTIVILNDLPIAIDGKGRFWFYDGYTFVLKSGVNIPAREDDFGSLTCRIHKNGSIADKGKVYVLIGVGSNGTNTSERALSGIWCYDPLIGLYHFSSPDNSSRIVAPYALAKGTTDQSLIAGYYGGTGSVASFNNRISKTETTQAGAMRIGFITTQFIESQNLTDMFNTIAIKYRKMIDPNAKIEVKYRTWKNIDCNTTITWTAARTFTCPTADLLGTSGIYNTPVAVGDEVFVQGGTKCGLIAHVVSMVNNAGTNTVTIDRDNDPTTPATSGTAYAMFSNYTLLGSIDINNPDVTFKSFRLAKKSTMIQVKIVMQWSGYYDEVQEILLPEQAQDTTV